LTSKKGLDALHEQLLAEGGGFVAHSDQPNCIAVEEGKNITLKAIGLILFGQLLTINYGRECIKWLKTSCGKKIHSMAWNSIRPAQK